MATARVNIGGFMKPLSANSLADITDVGKDNITNTEGVMSGSSFATLGPVTYIYDVLNTGINTVGTLTLGVSGNILQLTTGTTLLTAVSGGNLGTPYYVVNKVGSDVTIQNNSKIFVRAGVNLLLGNNQACQMICLSSDAVTVF